MKPAPGIEELDNPALYDRVLSLPYDEIGPFVLGESTRPSRPMVRVWIALAASLFLSVWFWPGFVFPSGGPGILTGLAAGLLLLPLALVPVHEGSHLIPFLLAGARDIRFGSDLKQGIIYVTAHRFVAGSRLFSIVALTPFIIITASLLVCILLTPPWWKWVFSMTLFVRSTMCMGDAALLAFMGRFGDRRVYTWDDADRKVAYFYASAEAAEEMIND
ncbi:DUF3267 domain-containing protein [bacterium]|nr:DUF3267 domain-containing protein [bacterium]